MKNLLDRHTQTSVGDEENHDSPRFLMSLRANCVLPSSPSAPPDTLIKGSPGSTRTALVR